jgi:hypothetical protein
MAVDRSRLAAALAYRQAEEERRRRMMESVPVPGAELPTPVPSQNLRRDLENLSIGIGEGLTNQLEGVKGIVTDPIGAARGAYEGVKAVVRDPAIIADALRYTAQKVGSGPLGAGEVIGEMVSPMRGKAPVMSEIDVYHGSPHRFEEFDASKIGTGEGAQAYGHGIYFAESPNVAQHYTTGGGGFVPLQGKDNVYFNGQWVQDFSDKKSPEGLAKYAMSQSSTGTTIKEKVETLNKIGRKDAADWLEKNADKFNQSKGNLYTADLPDEMVDRMLDWDKPLSKQPAAVRETVMRYMNVGDKQLPADMRVGQVGDKYVVLQDKPPLPGSTFGIGRSIVRGPKAASEQEAIDAYWNSLTGKDFYDTIGKDLGQNADASDYMRQLGIPGIKYLDAGSRGQGGSGTRNFVVFPGEEKKVKILKRE